MRWRKKKQPQRYVVVKVARYDGIAVGYFALDNKQVWLWTRQLHKAKVFLSPNYAETVVRQTSAEWEALWEVRPINI
jgi:hypothetical protein